MNSHRVELLVSVRSCDEIPPAIAGGCDLLDFKEPHRGALGMVNSATLQAISDYCAAHNVPLPLSMALGELIDWNQQTQSLRLPPAMRYLKLGLSGTATMSDWNQRWRDATAQIEATNQRRYDWIAVAYADWEQASAVPPLEVLSAAIENRCAGLLIDTFGKRGQGLPDLLSQAALAEIIEVAHRHGLKVALAGSLRLQDLELLSALEPDIIGIRGAACKGKSRTNRIQETAVRAFRHQLDQQFACS